MKLASFMAASLLFSTFALRAEQPKRPVEVSPYRLLDAHIEGLARASRALDHVNETSQASLVDRMTAVQNASIELAVVKNYLQPLTAARNEKAATAIKFTIDAYSAMQKALAITLSLYETLDAAKSEDDLVGMRRKISDGKVLYQQASSILVEATGVAFGSTLVNDPADPQNHVALPFTAAQKAQLIEKLDSRFSSKLREEPQEDDTGPLQAARLLLALLQKDWRLAGK